MLLKYIIEILELSSRAANSFKKFSFMFLRAGISLFPVYFHFYTILRAIILFSALYHNYQHYCLFMKYMDITVLF